MTSTISLGEIAEQFHLQCRGDAGFMVEGLATLRSAGPQHLSFLANPKYQQALSETAAGAVIIAPEQSENFTGPCLIADDPYLAYAKITRLFARDASHSGQDSSAVIGRDCIIPADCGIAANVVIGDRVTLGAGCQIGPGSVIGDDCVLGEQCTLHANVTIYPAVTLGNRVRIHSGAVIGSDGFGFAPTAEGWIKIAQLGSVRLGDDVDVGANTTIDRGALDDTVIERGVILDNLIQIAHNVQIGEFTAIAAFVGIAGSTRIGRRCTIGGRSSINGHIEIVDNCHITATSFISQSLRQAGSYSSGTFEQGTREWRRNAVRFNQLDELFKRVNRLEKKLQND